MAIVVAVTVVEAAVGSVELQRERERERLTVSSGELQRGSLPNAERSRLDSYNNAMASCNKFI